MLPNCPHCTATPYDSESRIRIYKNGQYWRKSDGRLIRKFKCLGCGRYFSRATFGREYRHKKRHLNTPIKKHLVERCSQRGIARLLGVSRTTVKRKLQFLGAHASTELQAMNEKLGQVSHLQFDDLETAEGTKYQPLHVTAAVVFKTRWILGTEVSRAPSKLNLHGRKFVKYGRRKDERARGRRNLFIRIGAFVRPDVIISSDQHPHYVKSVREHFPRATHIRYPARRPRDHGQDELKKGDDPLYSINHTFAMHRCRVSRLARKSWCLSKKAEPLRWHLAIYAVEHNKRLKIWKEISEI